MCFPRGGDRYLNLLQYTSNSRDPKFQNFGRLCLDIRSFSVYGCAISLSSNDCVRSLRQ
jgi:hypothetical protein